MSWTTIFSHKQHLANVLIVYRTILNGWSTAWQLFGHLCGTLFRLILYRCRFPHRYIFGKIINYIHSNAFSAYRLFRCNKEGVAPLCRKYISNSPQPSLPRKPRQNRDRGGPSSFQPVTIPLPCPKCETDLLSNPPSPPLLFERKKRDGGGHLPSNLSPSPSLARNARQRGPSSFQPITISLPCLKCETEGAGFLPTHPLPSLGMRDRGPVSFQPTSLARNVRQRGFFFFQYYPSPSLARNARQRGPASFQLTSLARNVRRRGVLFLPTLPISLPCSKRKMEGAVSFKPHPFPSLARNRRWRGSFPSNHPDSLPRSKQETEGVFPPPSILSLAFRARRRGPSLSNHTPIPSIAENARWRGCLFPRIHNDHLSHHGVVSRKMVVNPTVP